MSRRRRKPPVDNEGVSGSGPFGPPLQKAQYGDRGSDEVAGSSSRPGRAGLRAVSGVMPRFPLMISLTRG